MRYYINGTLLKNNPEGWKDQAVELPRNALHGIFRQITQQLEFVKDGAMLLRRAFYVKGASAEATLKVDRFDKMKMEWETIFEGLFDFGTFSDEGTMCKCTAIDGTLAAKIKAKENQEYVIDLPEPNLFFNSCKGYYAKAITSAATIAAAFTPQWAGVLGFNAGTFKLNKWSKESPFAYSFETYNVTQSNLISSSFLKSLGDLDVKANVIIPEHDVKVAIQIPSWNPALAKGFTYTVRLYKVSSPLELFTVYTYAGTLVDGGAEGAETFTVPLINENVELTLVANDELRLIFTVVFAEPSYNNNSDIRVTATPICTVRCDIAQIIPTFQIPCLNALQMFQRIITKIDAFAPSYSAYLIDLVAKTSNTIPYFTSGDALRGLPDPKIKISLRKFFAAMDNIFPIGIGIGETPGVPGVETVVLEQRDDFYAQTEFYLGEAKEMVINAVPVKTRIKSGYADKTIERPNGRQMFNSEQERLMPYDTIESEDDRLSPVSTDPIDILNVYAEGLEKRLEAQDELVTLTDDQSEDKEPDNEVFMIDAWWNEDRSRYELNRNKFAEVVNIDFAENQFNVYYSPRRCVIYQSEDIRSQLYGTTAAIVQTSFKKNVEFGSRLTTESAIKYEKDDILQSEMLPARLLPFTATLTLAQRWDFIQLLEKKYNKMKFTYNGIAFYGWLDNISVLSFDRGELSVSILLSSENDITKLIR